MHERGPTHGCLRALDCEVTLVLPCCPYFPPSHEQAKHTLFKQKIQVATLDHVLPPGMWQYPFSYQIPASVPGVVKVKRHEDAHDPEWRSRGRKLEVKAQTIFSVKAVLETRGVFSRDLKSRQEMTVNPFFDWTRMAPQKVSKAGQVLLCCCIPRGTVTLNAVVDKAAYQSGETMRVSATIQNDSASNIDHMVSRLNRFITLSDGKGHTKRIHDDLCRAEFPGVGPKSSATREMPLTLSNSSGPLLPSIKSPHISIEYRFDCECDIPWAPDIEAQMPVVIYQPAPVTFGLAAAFGGAVPAGMAAFMPASPAGGYGSPVGAGAGAMPGPGGALVVPNPVYH